MDPSRREFGGVLVLVARKLVEDGLGLVTELLVGRLTAGSLNLLIPEEDEPLDVGPVSEAKARA